MACELANRLPKDLHKKVSLMILCTSISRYALSSVLLERSRNRQRLALYRAVIGQLPGGSVTDVEQDVGNAWIHRPQIDFD
jgi:hypothetical protein